MIKKDCACVDIDARECFEKRYLDIVEKNEDAVGEVCGCPCHKIDDDDDDLDD